MAMPPSTSATLIGYFPQNGPGITDVVVETILLFLGFVSLGLRLWSRRIQRAQLQLNDWLILFAMLIMTTRYGIEVTLVVKCGMGFHIGVVEEVGGEELVALFSLLLYIMDCFWVTLVTLVKLSILHFYLQVFRQPIFKRAVYAGIGLCVAFWFGAFFGTALFCIPPNKLWYPNTPGHCGDNNKMYTACATSDLGIDVIIILLPMPILWRLQMATSKKIALTFVFGLGFVIISITAVRIKYMLEMDPLDRTYSISQIALFSAIVPLLGIINASMPIIPPALRKISKSSFLSTTIKKLASSKSSDRHFEILPEPEYPLVNVSGNRGAYAVENRDHIQVTTDWEIYSTEATDRLPSKTDNNSARSGGFRI
ncbi:hypothetical protein F5Y00DRAFT_257012 [Daldinia vernicosa]|uniref:uncharacterized protein n=1 Tax=Daldinia vernicosa TaxID=114800 RepID=UPI0020087176|nr:uncharacterized protein F5Y00DRAFT_257012 [Daldinia vernicosa]KAI0853708.1 hypothetical protein F5Y00DRAFT_257012 [Daldinia vernicosa]